MPDRKSLISTLCLFSALALPVLVLLAPIRTSTVDGVSTRPVGSGRDLAFGSSQPSTQLGAALATDVALSEEAFASEPEEQDRHDALDEPRPSFLAPISFRKIPDRQSIARRATPSLYPLRC